ncbi:alkaline phosphatase [Natronosporangium hydrolyticum]|uniref:Alkaline phosphatase n=1 Tax=Natronosporangium hydrolyticum TaxID=2811111 RepID=A0A895YA88_9ACTN|nr:alkaline phosphatase [Natronosporangium hydrolyticum]QSB14684.1 alkaline phosphatase [Natronosporangium hydrolyticum]
MPDQERSSRRAEATEAGAEGIGRRALLRAGGVGGVAAAAVVGLGLRPEAALAQPRDEAVTSPARNLGELHELDPHAHTARTGPGGGPRPAPGVRILPIDRAKFLVGVRFDLRVEASGVDPETARIDIEVHGPDGPAPILVGDPIRTSTESDSLEITYPQVTFPAAGTFHVRARVTGRGGRSAQATVEHEVVTAQLGDHPPAKNIIFFLGDGMGTAAITAARILSKGITEGKYHGLLEMDQLQYRGLVGTSGADALATDSANSMSAYMTGHKSSVNAMGVYEGNDPDPNNHPRVENLTELLKRSRDMAIGVVTTSEIQDATPAAVWAHTRRRSEYVEIMEQALNPEQQPDVLLGGGLHALLPQSEPGSRREDDRDLVAEFRKQGFEYADSRRELHKAVRGRRPEKLLGLFHLGNMNVYLDRQHAPDPEVLGEWTDQPNLTEMTEAALRVLERKPNGFFLMVEAASIDKMEHPLDGPRAVYDTIEFDQAIGAAKRWAAGRDDTLIVVTADHNHSMQIAGTHDKREAAGRAANGVYGNAAFPTYADRDGDGFPDDPAPDVELFFGWSNHPDHSDDFHHNPVFKQPALLDEDGRAVDNPERDPDAELQVGNLPFNQTNCVHTVEDVSVFASGPGAARFNAFLDNTELFFAMTDSLDLSVAD